MAQLSAAKRVAKMLLYTDMQLTDYAPVVVLHPYFESAILCDSCGMFNALEEETRYKKFLKFFSENRIDKCENLSELLCVVRKSYKLTYLKFLLEYEVITLQECGNLLASVWDLIENLNHDVNVSKHEVLRWIKNADKHILMNKEDYAVYTQLGHTVRIYRGCRGLPETECMSWTLSYETAEFFANRFNQHGKVFSANIDKKYIIGYMDERGEQEVIVDYKHLRNIEVR